VFGAVELKRDGLVDGYSHGFRRGIAVVPNVDGNRFSLHVHEMMSTSSRLSVDICESKPRTEAEHRSRSQEIGTQEMLSLRSRRDAPNRDRCRLL